MNRIIGHLDLDYFFAQVEENEDPSLRECPVVVCVYSGRTEESGVVSTANYKARELGVRSGMPISLAKKKLSKSDAKFIPMKHEKYEAISERIMQLTKEYADVLEQSGIDEAFFEITTASQGSYAKARLISSDIKNAIVQSEGLTSSIGVGQNKIIAKIASDFSKPNGLSIITPEATKAFLEPLPVEKLYGVGPKTAESLRRLGINLIGELSKHDAVFLEKPLGRKASVYLHNAANGINNDPVTERDIVTQISRIITLKRNTRDPREISVQLSPAISDLHSKLVRRNLGFSSLSVIAILSDLSVKTKNKSLETPTDDSNILSVQVTTLLDALVQSVPKDLRRVGIRVADLIDMKNQMSLARFQ